MNKIIEKLPKMLTGEELDRELEILPDYDESIRYKSQAERLIALQDIYNAYVPNTMSREIYSKLYLAMLRSLQKKQTKMATIQLNENYKGIKGKEYNGIIGGSDSFTIIGASGVGKSSAVSRAINLIGGNEIIETSNPYAKIVPCVIAQAPFDSSTKGLLVEVLRVVDEKLGTKYYANVLRARATTDMLIGSVSQVALNHIGLLVIDEIQHIVHHKNGKSLVNCLTQLINSTGISIAMVGTPTCISFFTQAQQLARRSLGLYYGNLEYGVEFRMFCEILFQYQYVQHKTTINDGIIQWLYEYTQGNLSMVVNLLHDAQEIAIIDGRENLNHTLNDAYKNRMSMLHDYIEPRKRKQSARTKVELLELKEVEQTKDVKEDISITDLVLRAKNECRDIVEFLRDYIEIERIKI